MNSKKDLESLVRRSGGTKDVVRRLVNAGFRTPKDLAERDIEEIRKASGLSAVQARWLAKSAIDTVVEQSGQRTPEATRQVKRDGPSGSKPPEEPPAN